MTNIEVCLFLFLAVAVITDLKSNRIPNWLLLIGLVVGLLTTEHLIESILGSFLIILIFFPLFRLGVLGAGDIKCMAMISLYLTQQRLWSALVYTFLLAAGIAVYYIFHSYYFHVSKKKVHLAVPIFLGTLISVGGAYL